MVRIDPLKYAQTEDSFEQIAKQAATTIKWAQRIGTLFAFLVLALFAIVLLVAGKFLLGLL